MIIKNPTLLVEKIFLNWYPETNSQRTIWMISRGERGGRGERKMEPIDQPDLYSCLGGGS